MFKLLDKIENTKPLIFFSASEIQEGYPFRIGQIYSFAISKILANTTVLIPTEGIAEVDCETDTYITGEAVYDSDSAPSGIVNKTSGTGRRLVGFVYESKPNANKIKIYFEGKRTTL